jgi:hypothetical protein
VDISSPTPSVSPASKKGGKSTKDTKNKSAAIPISISPEALPDCISQDLNSVGIDNI